MLKLPVQARVLQTGRHSHNARKPILVNYRITLKFTNNESLLDNLAGGVKQVATLKYVATGTTAINTGKAFGLQGGTFHVKVSESLSALVSRHDNDQAGVDFGLGKVSKRTADLGGDAVVFDLDGSEKSEQIVAACRPGRQPPKQ